MKHSYKEGDVSVGWFKLALLVSRGEKEKALALYRLLSYSFDDKAYILQVEGDLLRAFEDKNAFAKYHQAAVLYTKEKKIGSAIALYEYLVSLDSKNYASLFSLLSLYANLDWKEKVEECLQKLHVMKNVIPLDELRREVRSLLMTLEEINNKELQLLIEQQIHELLR